MSTRNFFLVTCIGHCATKWLAHVLSLHPDIFCTHGNGSLPDQKEEETDHHKRMENAAKHARMSLAHYLEGYAKLTEEKNIGNVHGYTMRTLTAQLKQSRSLPGSLKVVNMVRHPVSWVASAQAHYITNAKFSSFARQEMLAIFNANYTTLFAFAERYQLNHLDWEFLAFVWACYCFGAFQEDFNLAQSTGVNHIRMEDMTSNPEFFKKIVGSLVSEDTSIGANYLDEVFVTDAKNTHRKKPYAPEEQYDLWHDWQKELFALFYNQSKVDTLFRKVMHYDLDFIPQKETVLAN